MNIFQVFSKKDGINFKELVARGAVILDVRSKDEFAGGHVTGAINLPLDALALVTSVVSNKNTNVITCCMSGGRSSMATNILQSLGYTNVHNGGGWKSLQEKL